MHPSTESSGTRVDGQIKNKTVSPHPRPHARALHPLHRVKLKRIYYITILTLTNTIYHHTSSNQPYTHVCNVNFNKTGNCNARVTMRVVCFYQWFYYFNRNNLKRQSLERKIVFVHLIRLRSLLCFLYSN